MFRLTAEATANHQRSAALALFDARLRERDEQEREGFGERQGSGAEQACGYLRAGQLGAAAEVVRQSGGYTDQDREGPTKEAAADKPVGEEYETDGRGQAAGRECPEGKPEVARWFHSFTFRMAYAATVA